MFHQAQRAILQVLLALFSQDSHFLNSGVNSQRIICNSAAMMLAARMQIRKCRFGLSKCCILFVTPYCCMMRLRYCKEQLEERMTYIKYQVREDKYFECLRALSGRSLEARQFFFFFFCFFGRLLFLSSHSSMFFFLFTIQCKVYVRMILLRNNAIPSEPINTNGIRTTPLSLCACMYG
jgi:hypothetical protein